MELRDASAADGRLQRGVGARFGGTPRPPGGAAGSVGRGVPGMAMGWGCGLGYGLGLCVGAVGWG